MMELKGLKSLHGLDDLLAESKLAKPPTNESIYNLSIDNLQSGKYQPRSEMDESSLQELAASIQSQGIILPLIVRHLNGDKYEIIAGERRWRAAKMAGLQIVPAIIRDIPDETALAFALIENIQRESLNPMDEALAFARLKDDFSMTHEEIATRVGRSRSSVSNLLRLLGLCDEVKDFLRARKLEMGHARALLSLAFVDQRRLAEQIVEKSLSVREAEKLVQRSRDSILTPYSANKSDERVSAWENSLSKLLSAKVKINLNANGDGKVVVYVHSADEIDWLLETIKNGQN